MSRQSQYFAGFPVQDVCSTEECFLLIGLVMSPLSRLIVLETSYRNPSLVHMSQDGSKTWRFTYTPLVNAVPGSKCRFIGIYETSLIVSDLGMYVCSDAQTQSLGALII